MPPKKNPITKAKGGPAVPPRSTKLTAAQIQAIEKKKASKPPPIKYVSQTATHVIVSQGGKQYNVKKGSK